MTPDPPAEPPADPSADPPAEPPDGRGASAAEVARDLARKCVSLALGSGDPQTFKLLMDLSGVYDQCADLLATDDAATGDPAA